MPRQISCPYLENPTNRVKLAVRTKPYTARIHKGIRLAYRLNQSGGSWSVIATSNGKSWLQRFATADDREPANGSTVLDYWQACDMARKIARGIGVAWHQSSGSADKSIINADRPISVMEAVDAYESDLKVRAGQTANATRLRSLLAEAPIRNKPVGLLTAGEVKGFRKALLDRTVTRSTVNRDMKTLCACLTLAAENDDRITNNNAWRKMSLANDHDPLPKIITEEQVRNIVEAAYRIGGARFGVYIETLAVTGARASSLRRLLVDDLQINNLHGPRLLMPSSKKGKKGTQKKITRVPVPISRRLAMRLTTDRPRNRPLLLSDLGQPLTRDQWRDVFAKVVTAADLPADTTPYVLRHTNIVRQLLANIPARLVAVTHDTSLAMIEITYSRYIHLLGEDLLHAAVLDLDVPQPPPARVLPFAPVKA